MFLGNPSKVNAALQLVTTRALLLTKGSGAVIAIRDEDALVCRASIGEGAPPVGYRLDAASGFSGECVRSGEILLCEDTESDARVDAESCRALGIRSILAAPIRSGDEVVGLLEVFSPKGLAFDGECVAAFEKLAQNALPSTERVIDPPKLLIELEPARRVFFRNLADLISPPRLAPLKVTSLPARFWPDVFVPSPVPWERFRQSLAFHLMAIAVLLGAIELGLFQGNSLRPQTMNRSDVVYFSPEEYLQALAASGRQAQGSRHAASVSAPSLRVYGEKRTPGPVRAPDIKVKSELRALQLVAGGSVMPAPPVTSSALRLGPGMTPVAVVAPAPEVRAGYGGRSAAGLGSVPVVGPPVEASSLLQVRPLQAGGSVGAPGGVVGPPIESSSLAQAGSLRAGGSIGGPGGVVGPPVESSSLLQVRSLQAGGSGGVPGGVVGPPPSVGGQLGGGAAGVINVGHIEVVGPPPQMPGDGSSMLARVEQASLHGPIGSIVPPAPSMGGVGNGGARNLRAVAAVAPVALPPAIVRGATYPNAPPPEPHAAEGKSSPQTSDHAASSHEVSVSFIGLALSLRSSSYFASQEVFLAEDRLSKFQTKLIKLVYEFLPYQPRLSDYGPNYPAVDKLRVTRDPQCDEPLGHVVSSFNMSARPVPERLQQDLKGQPQQNTLECYRTTADDYRRARVRH